MAINQQEAAGLGRLLEGVDGRSAREGDVSDGDIVDGAHRRGMRLERLRVLSRARISGELETGE